MTPPIRPGPAVAATASTSPSSSARFIERLGDHAVEQLDMGAGGDFRDDAAIGTMGRGLAENDIGQNRAGSGREAADDRGRCLVAARFDAQGHGQGLCSSTHRPDLC